MAVRRQEGLSETVLYWYPGFEIVDPPRGSDAIRALRGTVVPFPDNSELGKIVQDLERDATVSIDVRGALTHDENCGFVHLQLDFVKRLVNMTTAFDILVLEYNDGRHRQTYCLRPEISFRTFPTHPHMRFDQQIWLDRPIQALCPYRSDETNPDDLTTYLDYVAIFLGKHLIWVRTLELKCYWETSVSKTIFTPSPNPGHFTPPMLPRPHYSATSQTLRQPGATGNLEFVVGQEFIHRWEGVWLGPSAPHDPETLLQTVSPHDECVCGSGRRYGSCCRPTHFAVSHF